MDDTLQWWRSLPEERRAPVDIFFRTLAETHGTRAVCVILSGTGADGSMGLKRIKERGGVVFVQNPREAAFGEMPRSAIATDMVDGVVPVAEIPARIMAYGASLGAVAIPAEAEQRPQDQQQALREVFSQLRVRTGHDFSNYKRPTLLRRIARRISVRNLPDLPSYATFLRENPDEVQALLKDLLISVTNFFRDTEAFAALERDIIPRVFAGKRADEQVRIWVIGCATGEEAYSIAMLCAERVLDTLQAPSVQIFASDIDDAAIAHAREGLYTLNDTADVSPERLRRFFTVEDGRYRIRREIREMVLFANHNVLKDPPFSHLDLASCRNMLIYLNHTAQERVMETLHFALNPGGYLFLGTSESVDGSNDLFANVSREQHIFQNRATATRPLPVPDTLPTGRATPARLAPPMPEPGEQARERLNYDELQQRLLEQYAPPSVLVNEEHTVLRISERAGRYMQIAGKEISNNLLQLIRPELRLELRSALYQAVQRQSNVQTSPQPVRIDNRAETVTIHVRPVLRQDDPARGLLLIVFEQGAAPANDAEPLVRSDEPLAHQLEDEVQRLRQQLRSSSEQYEYQAEELKATNEELQALNEELRSSAEELETSKEELQSINEELRTVNQELKVKVEEATQHGTNLQNLVNSADVGTIFLDRGLRIRLFTPAARALFNLIPADYGRPLSDITHRLIDIDVLRDAETVLADLQTIEREVRTTTGRVYMLRVVPYRAAEDRIGGAVLTFFDITERKRAEQAVRESEAKYRTLFETMNQGFGIAEILVDEAGRPVDYRMLEINSQFERLTGQSRKEFLSGRTVREVAPELEEEWYQFYGAVGLTGEPAHREIHAAAWDRWFEVSAYRTGLPEQRHVAILYSEITERKLRERNLAFLAAVSAEFAPRLNVDELMRQVGERLARHLSLSRCDFSEVDIDNDRITTIYDWRRNPAAPSVLGEHHISTFLSEAGRRRYIAGELMAVDNAWDSPLMSAPRELMEQLDIGAVVDAPYVENGRWTFLLSVCRAQPTTWRDDEVELIRELAARIYIRLERARAEQAVRESEAKYRTLFESIDEGFCVIEVIPGENGRVVDWIFREVNEAFARQTGQEGNVVLGKHGSEWLPNFDPQWLDMLSGVYETGGPLRTEIYAQDIARWVSAHYSRVGGAGSLFIAIVFNDITERKQRERQQAFLLKFSDALRTEQGADAVANRALEMLVEELRLDRSYITTYYLDEDRADLDYQIGNDSVPPLPEHFVLSDYPEAFKTTFDKTLVIEDELERQGLSEAEKRNAGNLGMRAMVAATLRKENKPLWSLVAINSRPRRWTAGEIALVEEVTERIWAAAERARAETALRESQARQTIILETMAEGVVILDREDRFVSLNRAAERILGMSRAELIAHSAGDPPFQRLTLAGEPWVAQPTLGEVEAAGDRAFQNEYMIQRQDGSRVIIRRTITALRDSQQRCTGFVSTITDITERKRAEEALRESEERTRIAVEAAELATWEWNLQADTIFWNEQHFRLFGLEPGENPVTLEFFSAMFTPTINSGLRTSCSTRWPTKRHSFRSFAPFWQPAKPAG